MAKALKQTQSAGGIVLNKDDLVLVVNQKGRSWSLPKGHIDPGETALEAAKREILEESGIGHLELLSDLGHYQRTAGDNFSEWKTLFMFLFRTNESKLKPLDPENPEARWIKRDEVANLLTHPKDKEFFLSVIEKI